MTSVTKRAAQLTALFVAAYTPLQLRADNCFTMLAPIFNNAKAAGNVPGQTYATVSKHYATGNMTNGTNSADTVRYAFGNLGYANLWWNNSGFWDTVSGTILYRQNTNKNASMDMFAPSQPPLTLKVAINANGMVSVQELLGGNPIGGMPPTVYQGICSSYGTPNKPGLIYVIDHSTAWVFSLTAYPPQWIK